MMWYCIQSPFLFAAFDDVVWGKSGTPPSPTPVATGIACGRLDFGYFIFVVVDANAAHYRMGNILVIVVVVVVVVVVVARILVIEAALPAHTPVRASCLPLHARDCS